METTEATKTKGKRTATKNEKPLTLIDAIETVIEKSEDSQLKGDKLNS